MPCQHRKFMIVSDLQTPSGDAPGIPGLLRLAGGHRCHPKATGRPWSERKSLKSRVSAVSLRGDTRSPRWAYPAAAGAA